MPMKTMTTFAIAVALGAAWSVAPAMATSTTDKVENKAERAADKVENKAERAADKVDGKDTVGDKFDRAVDKTKDKAGELKDKIVDTTKKAKDKVVDTTKKAKDKVVDKTDNATDKLADKTDRMDVRHMQQALKDKGFDPGPIDGIHGPRTSAAVREYQTKEGLTVTGRLDDDTMGRLNGTGTVRTGSDGTAPASPSASPATGPQLPAAKQTR
ncbi:MAG: peptidoglycan-binding domain-containing protein [Candidatus Rokuibacteriota bacterium]